MYHQFNATVAEWQTHQLEGLTGNSLRVQVSPVAPILWQYQNSQTSLMY